MREESECFRIAPARRRRQRPSSGRPGPSPPGSRDLTQFVPGLGASVVARALLLRGSGHLGEAVECSDVGRDRCTHRPWSACAAPGAGIRGGQPPQDARPAPVIGTGSPPCRSSSSMGRGRSVPAEGLGFRDSPSRAPGALPGSGRALGCGTIARCARYRGGSFAARLAARPEVAAEAPVGTLRPPGRCGCPTRRRCGRGLRCGRTPASPASVRLSGGAKR
jgi:hypothetical protein